MSDFKTIFDLEGVEELTPEILTAAIEDYLTLFTIWSPATVVTDYFNNSDHGFSHSQDVWHRCLQIIKQSPLLWQVANAEFADNQKAAMIVLRLACIFHDFARFYGASFSEHERLGADLALDITFGNGLAGPLYKCIIHHDYFCELVNGYPPPIEAMNPLAEIFRLADKTANSPAAEIRRYYETARLVAPDLPVYNPDVADEVRFNLPGSLAAGIDELTWFLLLFALQSTDFVYGETRDAYAYWARNKAAALEAIGDLCLESGQGFDCADQAKQTVVNFCQKNRLLLFC